MKRTNKRGKMIGTTKLLMNSLNNFGECYIILKLEVVTLTVLNSGELEKSGLISSAQPMKT